MVDIEKKKEYDRNYARKHRAENPEKHREAVRRSHAKHREENNQKRRDKLKNPLEREKVNEQARTRRLIHPENARKNQKKYLNKLKNNVYQKLGGKCIYCGCDIYEALEINHINGGGRKEHEDRKTNFYGFYRDILSGKRIVSDLELTCRVCNTWHYLVKLKSVEDCWEIKFVRHNI